MVKDAAEKAGGLEDSIAAVTGAAAGNADTLVTVSDKIVEISEDLSALNNHALAECTPPKVDNSKVSRKGNVLAGTHVTYTCNDGTFNSKGDKAPTVTLFCPGGGGELTEGVVPQCDKCDSACTKCGDTADTCTACSAKGQVRDNHPIIYSVVGVSCGLHLCNNVPLLSCYLSLSLSLSRCSCHANSKDSRSWC